MADPKHPPPAPDPLPEEVARDADEAVLTDEEKRKLGEEASRVEDA